MKLVNTRDIKHSIVGVVDDGDAEFDAFFDSKTDLTGPCRHIRIRPNEDKISLLLDGRNIMSQSLKKIGFPVGVPRVVLEEMLLLWREDRMTELHTIMKVKNKVSPK